MIKILIVGGTQCGSTRLFNFLRIIFEKKGLNVLSRWISDYKDNDQYDVCIIKAHDLNISICDQFDYVLLPYRDIRDAYISTVTRWPIKKDFIKEMLINLNLFKKFKRYAHFLFKYEEYCLEYNKNLLNRINVESTDEDILNAMREIEYIHSKIKVTYDNFNNKEYRKTLMCKYHNTSGGKSEKWRKYFSEQDNRKIIMNKEIRGFLKKRGYNLK